MGLQVVIRLSSRLEIMCEWSIRNIKRRMAFGKRSFVSEYVYGNFAVTCLCLNGADIKIDDVA